MADLRVKRLPVVTPDGTLEGIISRADIMGTFARDDDRLRDEVINDVLIGVLRLEEGDVSVTVTDGVVNLVGSVATRSESRLLEELSVRVEGVVSVESDVTWGHDDTKSGLGTSGLL